MMQRISNFISNNRKVIPLWSTAILALAAYAIGAYLFVGMRNPQVFLNLFRNSFLFLDQRHRNDVCHPDRRDRPFGERCGGADHRCLCGTAARRLERLGVLSC